MLKLVRNNSPNEKIDVAGKLQSLEIQLYSNRELITHFLSDLSIDNFSDEVIKKIRRTSILMLPDVNELLIQGGVSPSIFSQSEYDEVYSCLSYGLSKFLYDSYNKKGILARISKPENLSEALHQLYEDPNRFISDYLHISASYELSGFHQRAGSFWINMISSYGNSLEYFHDLKEKVQAYESEKKKEKVDFRKLNDMRTNLQASLK